MLKFVQSLALDCLDICLQFFMGNFSLQEEKFFTHNIVYFYAVTYPSRRPPTVMIWFSTLLPISAPFECVFVNKRPHSAKGPYSNIILDYGYVSTKVHLPLIAHKQTVVPHWKRGLMPMWVHKFFKWMISLSNFVAIARLVVLARKDPGTTSPWSSNLDLHFALFARFFKKGENKEGKFHRHMPKKFVISFKVSPSR